MSIHILRYIFYGLLFLIFFGCLVLLIMCLNGRVRLGKVKNDPKTDEWYHFQFLGINILFEDRVAYIAVALLLAFFIVLVAYIFGFEPIF